jgi:hypothetical protein
MTEVIRISTIKVKRQNEAFHERPVLHVGATGIEKRRRRR